MKKIKVTQCGIIHYIAGCNDCEFTAAIEGNAHGRERAVRVQVYKHVRKTGHKCWIESGTHTHYALENRGQ